MLYDKELLTIYSVDNGYVVKCAPDKAEKPKKGELLEPKEPTVIVAKSIADVLKAVKAELADDAPGDKEYSAGFAEATTAKS